MNTFTKTIGNPTKINSKQLPQKILFLLTGFLVSQFFLLNFSYSQHPQGGWVTLFGNISTLSLIVTVLLAIIACLITLWRSATDVASTTVTRKTRTHSYSKPATFMSISPE